MLPDRWRERLIKVQNANTATPWLGSRICAPAFPTPSPGPPRLCRTEVRSKAEQMTERILAHVDGTWRPDLDRNPADVVGGTSTRGDEVALSAVEPPE